MDLTTAAQRDLHNPRATPALQPLERAPIDLIATPVPGTHRPHRAEFEGSSNLGGMKTNTLQKQKHECLYAAFIRYVTRYSAVTACRSHDDTIASVLGCSDRTVNHLVAEAQARGDIEVESERVTTAHGYRGRRVIYLVSSATTEHGALMLATLLADRSRTMVDSPINRERLCGQLRCTPGQLEAWSTYVLRAGWFTYGKVPGGATGWTRVGTFERVDLPDRPFLHGEIGRLAPPPTPDFIYEPEANGEQRLIAFIAQHGGSVVTSLTEIAKTLGFSSGKTYVSRLAARLEKQGKLTRTPQGRYLRLQLATLDAARGSDRATEEIAQAVAQIAAEKVERERVLAEHEAFMLEDAGYRRQKEAETGAFERLQAAQRRYYARTVTAAQVVAAANFVIARKPLGRLMDRVGRERLGEVESEMAALVAKGAAYRESARQVVANLVNEVTWRYESTERFDTALVEQRAAARAA